MSDQPDKSEKTEDPSDRKLEEAHRKGDVAKSQEVTTWFMMLGSALLFAIMGPGVSQGLSQRLGALIANADQIEIGSAAFGSYFTEIAQSILGVALLPLALLAVCAVAGNMVQHPPVLSIDPIKPKFSKVSPLQGAKRLFSTEALFNFAKGIVKLAIVGGVIFAVMWPERDRLDALITTDLASLLWVFQELAIKVFVATLAVVTVVAVADYLYQRYKWWEKQKMTVKEVRDEYKNMEGDPQVKARIRQIRNERGRQRMMSNVPDATVVVTNPTHFAVALKYENSMAAPVCVAKGTDAVALRIRELAKDSDVPIVENPPLARVLYKSVEIDDSIPAEHFKAVAQVIGYVMRLKSRSSWKSTQRA